MIRAVFFDAGEVLLRMPPWGGRVAAALFGLGIDGREARIGEAVRKGEVWQSKQPPQDLLPTRQLEERHALGHLRVVAKALGLAERDIEYLRETCYYTAVTYPFPDVLETLAALRGMGLRIGLISNAPPSLRAIFVTKGLMPYFDSVTLSSDVGCLKPGPAIYEAALARLGVSAAESVYVDDLPPNVDEARTLGFAQAFVLDRDGHAPSRRDRLPGLSLLPAMLAPQAPTLSAAGAAGGVQA